MNASEMKHTPGPWFAEPLADNGRFRSDRPTIGYVGDFRIVAEGRGYDSHEDDEADAAYIVRAVNSHADMLAALNELAERAHYAEGTADANIKRADEAEENRAAMAGALDRIFSYVSYVNIHGVGEQPEPNGSPQVVRVSLEEFARIFQEIGKLASAAIAKAEGRAS